MALTQLPIATYRLQFGSQFTLRDAIQLIPYLQRLGISHCYASPLFASRRGSTHGYDVIDQNRLDPAVGTLEDFQDFVIALQRASMGLIVDIVPNHMYIGGGENRWWQDVLEHGPASRYADYFDIDWHPPRPGFDHKVFLPWLSERYGVSLDNQAIRVRWRSDAFVIEANDHLLPTDPKSWVFILKMIQEKLSEQHPAVSLLNPIFSALDQLPPTSVAEDAQKAARHRDTLVIKTQLKKLFEIYPELNSLLQTQLTALNGIQGEPRSFDALDRFLDQQPYRLCYWRVANDEINYRRFFDIFDYAGLRTEKPEVFQATHGLITDFIQRGWVQGLRIDHIDGLWDPQQYTADLQDKVVQGKDCYVVAEKILTGSEELSLEWRLQGTVGYDFLNLVNGVFVCQSRRLELQDVYHAFTGLLYGMGDLLYSCKRLVLEVSLCSELNALARRLDRIAIKHRSSQDYTSEGLKAAIRDVIASFPIYRSYIQAETGRIQREDRQSIATAVCLAKGRNPTAQQNAVFDFLQEVLLLENLQELEGALRREREDFVMRFQQMTGPVMAKGLEDTAFYRYYPLASLCEVGGDPYGFGTSVDTFHAKNVQRHSQWPGTMLASTTHDTKRSEDVRSRINVLSEMPSEWHAALLRWSAYNKQHLLIESDGRTPDANEEYLLYQTLVGTWPLEDMNARQHEDYVRRIQRYMEKAIKEAKLHISWINPHPRYEEAIASFVDKVLPFDSHSPFLNDFVPFVRRVARFGMLNSLSQLVLKLTCPGVPDTYQGSELWDFSLVDPDNRRPVDFKTRRTALELMRDDADRFSEYIKNPEDGRIKMLLTMKILDLRQQLPELFSKGEYVPLTPVGALHDNVIAFMRRHEGQALIIIVGRFFSQFMENFHESKNANPWLGTYVEMPPSFSSIALRDVLHDCDMRAERLQLNEVFKSLPIALLGTVIV